MAIVSDLSKAPFSGINNETNNKNVNKTIMCAIILFSFFSPEESANKIIPNTIGINDVGEPVDKNKYGYAPQNPNIIKVTPLMRFALCGLIVV